MNPRAAFGLSILMSLLSSIVLAVLFASRGSETSTRNKL